MDRESYWDVFKSRHTLLPVIHVRDLEQVLRRPLCWYGIPNYHCECWEDAGVCCLCGDDGTIARPSSEVWCPYEEEA